MKVSVKLCFCQFLPFLVLFVTKTFAMINHNIGLTFGKEFQNKYPSYKPPSPRETLCPMEKKEKERASESSIINTGAPETNYFQREFDQKVDHYDSTDDRSFKQRYFVYKGNNYKSGNPVFLLVGGVDEIEPYYLEEGIWNHFATETGALLLALEHRMCRKSYPFKNFSTNYLIYLDSEQALADLAYFIDELVHNNPEDIHISPDTKWIALGSSYGGTLAARLKLKFSHKVKAAVTVNALLLPTAVFQGFYTVIENLCIMEKIDKTIKKAFHELNVEHLRTYENSPLYIIDYIKKKFRQSFNICNVYPPESKKYKGKEHLNFCLWSLATIIGLALQFGNESGQTVKTDVIKILLDEEKLPKALDRLGAAVKKVFQSHGIPCLNVDYLSLIDKYQDTDHDGETYLYYILYRGLGNRQTLYLRCTEFGYFETIYEDTGLFANLIPKDFYEYLCEQVFGPEFHAKVLERAVKKTKMFHGGREINVSNVLFIMHDDDLWTQLGYSNSKPTNEITEEDSVAVLLKKEDGEKYVSPELIDKWNLILRTLKRWSGVETTKESSKELEQNSVVIPIEKQD